MTPMRVPHDATQWLHHWLYDWGGANTALFLAIQRSWPDRLMWIPEILSAVGSYWGAPVVVLLLLVWARPQTRNTAPAQALPLCRFMLGVALAMGAAAMAKTVFALPRPSVLLGEAAYRAASAPDSRYGLPSGHAVYIGVLAAALWPLLRRHGLLTLLGFVAAVGWSRVVLGAHFPVDVIAGVALGWISVACIDPAARRLIRRWPSARVAP
jgi:membrane-associated phospholipid phosphatase